MSGRNRRLLPVEGMPDDELFIRQYELHHGREQILSHPAVFDRMRDSHYKMDSRSLPPHPAIIEKHLASQHQEIQVLLDDNHTLAATHVALKQELEFSHHELQRMAHFACSMHPGKDIQMREMYEKSISMQARLREVDAKKNEFTQLQADIKELSASKQELNNQVHAMNYNLARDSSNLQQAPELKEEIESMKHELQKARAAIEYEKKGYAENYEHGQAMEKNLVSIARELERLRTEIANSESRTHAAAVLGNPGYSGHYGSSESGYQGQSYVATYGTNPAQSGAEALGQYGAYPP